MNRFLENRARYRANNPENPPDICGCVEKGCDNPMPYIRAGGMARGPEGTVPCPVCGGCGVVTAFDSVHLFWGDDDCENCEDGRVPCECECHGGEK